MEGTSPETEVGIEMGEAMRGRAQLLTPACVRACGGDETRGQGLWDTGKGEADIRA